MTESAIASGGEICVARRNLFQRLADFFRKYQFLLEQLVARDFKAKYKRSVLGIFWSFLNPLLTMLVQYIVFSKIFRSNVEYYPAYLLTGTVIFNFFTEATSIGLTSITVNASLLTKVALPKPIFPIARLLSSSINFALSCIPLLAVVLLTGVKLHWTALLFPFAVAYAMIFTLGMIFLLSTLMVYFRDVQFLWGVVTMLWMYATPLFYTEDIIPDKFNWILLCNPLRHFLRFARNVLLNGHLPPPSTFVYCTVFSVGMLAIGFFAFRKNQDKFVLYL